MDLDVLTKALKERDDAMLAKLTGIDNTIAAEKKAREELECKLNRQIGLQPVNADGIHAAEIKEFGECYRKLALTGDKGPLNELLTKTSSYMEVGTDPAGGYAVIPSISNAITRKVQTISPIRQEATVIPIGTDALEQIDDTQLPDVGWVGETQSRPNTNTPEIGRSRIPVNELEANPKITQKLLDDSFFNVGDWLVSKLATGFAKAEGAAFVLGDGAGKPEGIFTAARKTASVTTGDATRAWHVVQHIITGEAAGLKASGGGDCLVEALYELKADYLANAKWYMTRRTAGAVRRLKDDQKQYLWQPSMIAGQADLLLGLPVVFVEDMDALGAGTFPIMVGDLKAAYLIADRHGDKILRDPFTSKPWVQFYTTRRVGGGLVNSEAIKWIKCST